MRLTDAETRYSTFDRELLAVRKFQHLVEGRRLVLYTDLKPLTTAMAKSHSASTWPQRVERQLLFISQFSVDLCHVACEANQVADALLRPPIPPPLPFEDNFTHDFEP